MHVLYSIGDMVINLSLFFDINESVLKYIIDQIENSLKCLLGYFSYQ